MIDSGRRSEDNWQLPEGTPFNSCTETLAGGPYERIAKEQSGVL